MKKEEITLKWKKDEKVFRKEVEREKLMATFEGLIKGFSPNNTVSKQLAEIIPTAEVFKINWDNTAEINQLFYCNQDKEIGSISIIHTHSVVWAVLAKLCEDGVEIPLSDF